jgi:hypothetical protein
MTSTNSTLSGPAAILRWRQGKVLRARPGRDDVAGFTVVGQPFASGDLLCLRSFPASTFGPGYLSVWHRSPTAKWTVYTSTTAEQSCPRFIGAAASQVVAETLIEVEWTGPSALMVRVPAAELQWSMHIESTPVTFMMNFMLSLMPAPLFRSGPVLAVMALMSTAMLAAGRFRLSGHVPNRQWFQAAPRRVWMLSRATATLGERDLGQPQRLKAQARLGEVPMPQRGLLMSGSFSFEAYSPSRHLPPCPAGV